MHACLIILPTIPIFCPLAFHIMESHFCMHVSAVSHNDMVIIIPQFIMHFNLLCADGDIFPFQMNITQKQPALSSISCALS